MNEVHIPLVEFKGALAEQFVLEVKAETTVRSQSLKAFYEKYKCICQTTVK